MQLKARIEGMLISLGRTKPELADGIKRWQNYILKAVSKVSRVTGRDEEDVLGEIFLGVVKVDEINNSSMCRYEGHNYKIVGYDGPLVAHLQTLSCNVRLHEDLWTSVSNLKLIRTGKLESSIYREIKNQCTDMLTSNFTKKRGYTRKKVGTRISKRTGRKMPMYEVVGSPYFVDVDESFDYPVKGFNPGRPSISEVSRYLCSQGSNPEEAVALSESISDLWGLLSSSAGTVFGCMLENPTLSDGEIAEKCRLTKKSVKLAREEIVRGYEVCIDREAPLDINARRFIRLGEV